MMNIFKKSKIKSWCSISEDINKVSKLKNNNRQNQIMSIISVINEEQLK